MNRFAYIGCRTSTWRGARGKGIEVFRIDDAGRWHHVQCVAPVQDNPSWLTLDRERQRLYVVHGDGDEVATYACDADSGKLTLLGQQTTGPRHPHPALDPLRRNNPVHTALSPDGNYLLIANHEGGNIAALPLSADGTLLPPESLTMIEGHPVASGEAPGLSRPHEIIFAPGSTFFALPAQGRKAGNGIDMIRIYQWREGQPNLSDELQLPAGIWQRHVDFHPSGRWLYGLSELGNTLTVCDFDAQRGKISLKQTISSLPEGYSARSDASEIEVHPCGRFLYAANRGHDSIGVFAIDQRSGELTPIDWVPCGGKTPRFTTLSRDGSQFFSANEDSDTITVFNIDRTSGMLHASGEIISTASPTCIVFSA